MLVTELATSRSIVAAFIERKKMMVGRKLNLEIYKKDKDAKLSIDELACALYEGSFHIANLAEKLARQHGQADALSFYDMMGKDVQAFWKDIAQQLIKHSEHWLSNDGSCCILDEEENQRLQVLCKAQDENTEQE